MNKDVEDDVLTSFNRIMSVLETLEDKDDECVQCIFEDARTAFKEWKPTIVQKLSEGIVISPANDLFNLVVRPTSIGTEYYLRENVTGQATSLVKRIDW